MLKKFVFLTLGIIFILFLIAALAITIKSDNVAPKSPTNLRITK